MTRDATGRPSTPSLIGDAIRQAMDLFATEIALVQLEASEKLRLVLASIASLVVAGALVIVALVFLLQGLADLLIRAGFAASQASFMIGGGLGVLALVAILVAARNLSAARLMPTRTIGQIQTVTTSAKTTVNRITKGRSR